MEEWVSRAPHCQMSVSPICQIGIDANCGLNYA